MSTDEGVLEGGVSFREDLGKYVVEFRPPGFKWTLWMGTYATVDEGRKGCDYARYYCTSTSGERAAGGFYFADSPALFGEREPLLRPVIVIGKGVKDRDFNVELKKRAKMVIRKVVDAQRAAHSAQSVEAGLSQCESSEILSPVDSLYQVGCQSS